MFRFSHMGLLLVTVMMVATACSSGTDNGADACAGLADRWVVLQQRVLEGLDSPGGIDDAAANSNAAAMLEQARDAESVGCTAALAVGSPLLCGRLDRLRPGGPAGEELVAELAVAC